MSSTDIFGIPQITGYIAYAMSFYGCLQKDDNRMFRFLAYAWILFSAHHFMLGNYTACSSGVVLAVRMYLSQYYKGAKMAYPFALLAIAFAVPTYQSAYSLLPLGAVLLGTFGSAYFSGIAVRASFVGGSCLWFIHNFATHSIGGMALDVTTTLMHAITSARILRDRKKVRAEKQAA